jgi:two-component system CitB family sensor kinase
MAEVPDPMVGGLLIGKFNRAKELKVELEIDEETTFADIPPSLDRSYLGTILGNLIDNGIEAVLKAGKDNKRVSVFLTDIGDDLIIEVEDSGIGIDPSVASKIFEAGYSTKETKGHGYGLALVRHAVKELDGHVSFAENPAGGTIFTVVIPKEPGRGEG